MAERKGPSTASLLIASAALISVPLSTGYEGLRTHPYRDPGNPKLMTVCYGETEREMRTYTPQECADLLRQRQMNDYAPLVLKCVPGFADKRRRYAFAASIDASYNAGVRAFCRSRMARAFNEGQWQKGCDDFSGWYVTGGGKPLLGLVRRREAERSLCLKAVA